MQFLNKNYLGIQSLCESLLILMLRFLICSKLLLYNRLLYDIPEHGLANYSTWATCGFPPILVNEVLLEHCPTQSLKYSLGLLWVIMNYLWQTLWPAKPKILTVWSFTEKSLLIPILDYGLQWKRRKKTWKWMDRTGHLLLIGFR